jgi:shikimate dehydrogenase
VISAATRVAAVIGDPVRHSLSPVLHNAAYRALDLDWVYVAFEVPDGATAGALAAMRSLGLAGLSVTMPHKTAAAEACDELSSDAAALHSVNTVTPIAGGGLRGESTDGEGFLRSLRDAGVDLAGLDAVVLGAGGAARAVVLALARAGASVTVSARREAAAVDAAQLGIRAATCPWPERSRAASAAALVVNATPIGMGDDASPLPPEVFRAQHVVVDLVYHPIETALLSAARARGATVLDGLGMLVHQAALQVERWTGQVAPVAAMRAAAVDALG